MKGIKVVKVILTIIGIYYFIGGLLLYFLSIKATGDFKSAYFPFSYIVTGGVFLGIAFFMKRLKKSDAGLNEKNFFYQREVTAQIVDISRWDQENRIHLKNYRITARWRSPADGKVHTFYSEDIFYDPSSYIASKGIKEVKVILESSGYDKYWVDISFLPGKH
ncbi:hypothetical protein RBH29_01910 [Herbivorax sp. ANBcel31]|uniref:hypothetical protein n=1 Tax=Herbivorax sp. ANBcel31 TaxID=3069754 RepID=UPI0027B5B77E|nr:hypothetical protein [Herbivorax sp. ANBcel31]MDQ2085190.1 hypothetical protein [Herbivorax sp. ANBcel31]